MKPRTQFHLSSQVAGGFEPAHVKFIRRCKIKWSKVVGVRSDIPHGLQDRLFELRPRVMTCNFRFGAHMLLTRDCVLHVMRCAWTRNLLRCSPPRSEERRVGKECRSRWS